MTGVPMLSLVSDIPARAMAHCMNGDSPLTTTNNVHFSLSGTFGPLAFTEDCLFHKNGTTSYFVDVEVSWAERSRQKVEHHQVHTVSCMYDDHGFHVPSNGSKDHWFIAPKVPVPTEAKSRVSAPLSLRILDERGSEIFSRIPVGRRIKLVAEGSTGNTLAEEIKVLVKELARYEKRVSM
ncbi:vitelline envelope sperm lysin receptor-like [Liolophura sinensis]|uniref:vitelline envelope sperm lysin receptor-like n=1 Tax=Liolophura sinensis TaxID=3198878 RepID=UPI0031581619